MNVWVRRCVVAALLNLGSSACGGSSTPAKPDEAAVPAESILSCAAWHREALPGADAVLINNVWNEQWAAGQPYEQCLKQRPNAGTVEYGWSWDWPAYRPYASYAAPEVLVGWKAWDGGASTTPSFPRRVDALRTLTLDFAAEIQADDTYNLNASLWVTTSATATAEPNPADIRNEVMVWFSNPSLHTAGDEPDGSVTLDGITFDVAHTLNHPDGSGGSTQTWTMVSYISREPHFDVRFDLGLVLQDAVAKGLVDPTHAVGGVELVTEVFGGKGELWLERFEVTATP